jgi:glycosyltransferase involved in cell wall biosynthesis
VIAHPSPRRSLGGHVVENGLTWIGYDVSGDPGVALVETARPGRRAYDVVLAQSAWNVIPRDELRQRLSDYPRSMRRRALARRAVSVVNLKRARRVVCLTEAMAELCSRVSRRVEVAPVTVPADCLDGSLRPADPLPASTLLVPGTVTWYKDPLTALDLYDEVGTWTSVVYAGGDDGSGCWAAVEAEAARRGIPAKRTPLSREEMVGACASADAIAVLSRLESLSFSMSEALILGRAVYASTIPAHRELAHRLGRSPRWWPGTQAEVAESGQVLDLPRLRQEWEELGRALGLPTSAGARP